MLGVPAIKVGEEFVMLVNDGEVEYTLYVDVTTPLVLGKVALPDLTLLLFVLFCCCSFMDAATRLLFCGVA